MNLILCIIQKNACKEGVHLNFKSIDYFLTVVQEKSISKAAEELYISQSSLSLRLKTLEEALGTPLLLRGKGKREVVLTAAGQTFYELALQYQDIAYKMETLGQSTMVEKLRNTFLPLERIIRFFFLPTIKRKPSSSIRPKSPVLNQSPSKTSAVA